MGQPGSDADFAEEPVGSDQRRDFRLENLDGDEAVVFEIRGEVNSSHAAGTQLALEPVAVSQSGFEPLQLSGCGAVFRGHGPAM